MIGTAKGTVIVFLAKLLKLKKKKKGSDDLKSAQEIYKRKHQQNLILQRKELDVWLTMLAEFASHNL